MTNRATTFLIVEDNDLDVEKLMRAFKRLRISNSVICARNGYDALDILRGTNGKQKLSCPYVILLDINMPQMNGLEFLHELRADASLANSPVFVLTTSDSQNDVDAAYEHNVHGYIVKPVTMERMIGALSTLNMYWTLTECPLQSGAR